MELNKPKTLEAIKKEKTDFHIQLNVFKLSFGRGKSSHDTTRQPKHTCYYRTS